MSANNLSGDHDKVEPTIRDGLIGAAIGLLLMYGGTFISNWILRRLVVGVGLIFVVVMTGFVISVAWTKASPRVYRIMSRARGHVRSDPQLGMLVRNVEAEAWEGEFKLRDHTVEILIDGKGEPDPALVARARVPIRIEQDPSRFRPADVPVLVGDATRLRNATGWRPEIAFERMIDDLLDFWRKPRPA